MGKDHVSGLSILVEWANGQDQWIRALAWEVINSRSEVAEGRVSHFYDLFLREKELKAGDPVLVGLLNVKEDSTNDEDVLILTSLRDVEHVNALARKQEITFHPRLTILFGENATGKTGYVRVLKRVASVRSAEPILPDVRQSTPASHPSASIAFRLGDKEHSLAWRGEEGVHPLARLDIFDVRATAIHVDEELTYVYTPKDLAMFPLVHRAVEQVKERLEQERFAAAPKGNPFLARFARETKVFPKVESLGASTDLAEIQTLATVLKEEEAELEFLRSKVDALRSSDIDARLEVARAEVDLHRTGLKASTVLSKFSPDQYIHAVANLKAATERHTQATQLAFASDDIPGILGAAWRRFVEAGEEYIQQTEDNGYPTPDDLCIYCRQSLTKAAIALIRKYRDFCNSELKKAVGATQQDLKALMTDILELDLESVDHALSKKLANAETERFPALTSLSQLVTLGRGLQEAGRTAESSPNGTLPDLARETARLVEARLKELDALTADLGKQIAERKETLERETLKLRELEGRLTLRALLPEITEYVEKAKWANKADTLLGRFFSIAKSLTEASKRASEHLLNQDFEALFEEECRSLRAPHVTLDFPGRRGQPARRKSLTGEHKLSEILSEGEQKVIALADFVAEARLRRKPSPIVFDDPVTSLDYRRMPYLVDRLVELSSHRQVIVFTHNIWFTTSLLTKLEDENIEYSCCRITESDGQRGFVAVGSPRTDSFGDLKAKINELIQTAAKEKGEAQAALIEKAYERIRAVCEVVVEKDLLAGVTERYQPNVRMTVLSQIKADRLPVAVALINPIYDKACRYIASHSQPVETLNIRPTLNELRADWQNLQDARQAYLNK